MCEIIYYIINSEPLPLTSNKSQTLPVETRVNIVCTALSPDGRLAIVVTEGMCELYLYLMLHALTEESILF